MPYIILPFSLSKTTISPTLKILCSSNDHPVQNKEQIFSESAPAINIRMFKPLRKRKPFKTDFETIHEVQEEEEV